MTSYFGKVLIVLDSRERWKAALLLGAMILAAVIDMIGVASVIPIMTVLANPDMVNTNAILREIYGAAEAVGVKSTGQFLYVLSFFYVAYLFLSIAVKAFVIYFQAKFSSSLECRIGEGLLEVYLKKDYSWFLSKSSAELGKSLLSEISALIAQVVSPSLTIFSQGVLVIALCVLLFLVDAGTLLIVASILFLIYLGLYVGLIRVIGKAGKDRFEANNARYVAVSEIFGGIKEIKFNGIESLSLDRFIVPARRLAECQVIATTVAQLPRFLVEGVVFGVMMITVISVMSSPRAIENTLPILTLYAYTGYKLLPAVQQIYASLTKVRYGLHSLDEIEAALFRTPHSLQLRTSAGPDAPVPLQPDLISSSVQLCDVTYSYPGAVRTAVKNVDMIINVGEKIGIVGLSGSGKTTIVDLFMGLLKPASGIILVDGVRLDGHNLRAYMRAIGYVPQSTWLSNESILSNIVFGSSFESTDWSRLQLAVMAANLDEWIQEELESGYDTLVGERGVRLSGGQRQRIGIARALYKNPKLLILDEATSALDNITAALVINRMQKYYKGLTILAVGHRAEALAGVDRIYVVENGRVSNYGSFDDLSARDAYFNRAHLHGN